MLGQINKHDSIVAFNLEILVPQLKNCPTDLKLLGSSYFCAKNIWFHLEKVQFFVIITLPYPEGIKYNQKIYIYSIWQKYPKLNWLKLIVLNIYLLKAIIFLVNLLEFQFVV